MSLVLVLLLLIATVAVTPFATRALGRHAGWPLAALYLLAAGLLLPVAARVLDGEHPTWSRSWVPSLGVDLALRADGLGIVFAAIALLIGAVVLVYATGYLGEGRQTSFYLLIATFTAAMVGLVLADDVVLLFICWELTSLASFLLVARSGRAGEAASMRTLLITVIGGLSLLAALGTIVARLGTTSLPEILHSPVWQEDPAFAALVAVLVAIAAFTKSAQLPFHIWLPDAMAAATPVSAYLHAAAVVKAGIFLMLRFSPAFADVLTWQVLLLVVGLATAVVGGFSAMRQHDLKKLMAYSTVSQLGFITAAIGVGTPFALSAAVLHTIAHALFKSGLFMMIGVIDHAAGTRDLRRLPPLARAMPGSLAITAIGCASMAGIPPLLGFVSKEGVLTALGEAPGGEWAGMAALAVGALAAVLTVIYCGRIVFGGFVDGPRTKELTPVPRLMIAAAALPILVGLPLALVVGVLDGPVAMATRAAGGEVDLHLALWHGVTLELVVTLLVLLVGGALVLARRRLAPFFGGRRLTPDGAEVLGRLVGGARRVGITLANPVRVDHPARAVVPMVGALTALLLGGVLVLRDDLAAAPLTPDLERPYDLLTLFLVTLATLGVVLSRTRLSATLCLGGVGILATTQLMALGAPDVALTQLLVECLTVVVIMLVLTRLPRTFERSHDDGGEASPIIDLRRLVRGRVVLSVATGVAVAVGTWALTSRRERSPLAEYYLQEGPAITGGANIVNTILVEFRALDTLGEMAVLGMAGVAVIAVLASVRSSALRPRRPRSSDPAADGRAPEGATHQPLHRAISEAWPNTVALQLLVRAATPVLAGVSLVLFWRGHNEPGGGFIAALVAAAVVALLHLSTSSVRRLAPPRLPLLLVGGGLLLAVGTGLWGLLAGGTFLQALHTEALGQHWSSSLVFDLGVYLAVLGLIVITVDVLGALRVDEGDPDEEADDVDSSGAGTAVPARPARRSTGGRAADGSGQRVGPRRTHLADDQPPAEVGQ